VSIVLPLCVQTTTRGLGLDTGGRYGSINVTDISTYPTRTIVRLPRIYPQKTRGEVRKRLR
jgi:hypothetical protein